MKFTIGTKKVQPPPIKTKKQKSKDAKDKKASLQKRRKETETLLFGSELFEPIMKKDRIIAIHFPETCTNEGIYISKCGEFGYRRSQNEFTFELFYFTKPLLDYDSDIIIIPSDETWLFDNLTPEELEDLVCRLKRAEFAKEREEEKKKILEGIREAERARQEELDRADAEFLARQEKEELNLFNDESKELDRSAEVTVNSPSAKVKSGFQPLQFGVKK